MQAVAAALDAAAEFLGQNREHSRQRQAIINSHADLLERELIKMARLAEALAEGLRRRGVPEPDASLAAEAGVVVFRVAFSRWVAPDDHTDQAGRDNGVAPGDGGRRGASRGEAGPGVSLRQMMRDDLARLSEVTMQG
jgi:hypothetical protein